MGGYDSTEATQLARKSVSELRELMAELRSSDEVCDAPTKCNRR
jgi:hypothetical protein